MSINAEYDREQRDRGGPAGPLPPGEDRNRGGPPSRKHRTWEHLIWALLLVLLASFFFSNVFQTGRVQISYTEFKSQVRDGNISEVTFRGNNILGSFEDDYVVTTGEEKADSTRYRRFETTRPNLEDTGLLDMLEEHDVTIKAVSEDGSWFPMILYLLLPWLLIIGLFVYARSRMQKQMGRIMGGGGGLFGIGKSRAKKFRESASEVRFEDVAGLENPKKDLREIIEYLRDPGRFTTLGADVPKGILIVGPPGTGKTLLARATAGEAEVPFYSISGSEFIEMLVGVGASRVRDLFQNAKAEAPSIIFIDELDSVGRARGTGLGGGHDEREQTLNQILSEMDGFEPHESVVVLAATNRPDVLDPALTRPGRFDRRIRLELPQKKARKKILEIHVRDVPLADDVDLENLAARTVGFSGADLKNLVNEAALLAGRKEKKEVGTEDFEQARDKILLGSVREEMLQEEERRRIAYHEAGHALVAKSLPDTDPLQKVTIIPRGRSLGATEQVPEVDRHNFQRTYLMNRVTVMLGGRAAESVVIDDISNGAADDLKQVTQLVRKMVCQWGMSEKLGPVYFQQGEEHLFLGREMTTQKDFSEHTAEVIDEEIRSIVTEMEEKARSILTEERGALEAIAGALMEQETLDRDDIEEIIQRQKSEDSDR